MKVGFIVECGPEGAETKVIPYLAKMIREDIEIIDPIPLNRKPNLKEQCGKFAKQLLSQGCQRVIIIWDLMPDWGEYEGKGCQYEDRIEIYESLKSAGLNPKDKRIRLVCIHKMLEAWIIADERALSRFLSTPAHQISVPRNKKPESITDTKSALITLFRKSGSRIGCYIDYTHAIKIVEELPDLGRLLKLKTFARFKDKLTR